MNGYESLGNAIILRAVEDYEDAIGVLCTPYYWESEFEYRGQTYTVTYSSGFSAFKQTPAYIQHREAQTRIDKMLDNPKPVSETASEIKPSFEEQLDEIWEMLGW